MTPHERALLTIKALEIRKKKKLQLIDKYEREKKANMVIPDTKNMLLIISIQELINMETDMQTDGQLLIYCPYCRKVQKNRYKFHKGKLIFFCNDCDN